MSTIKNSCSMLIAVLFALFGVKQAQAEWVQTGAADFAVGSYLSLALNSSGTPYVAFSECMDVTCSVTEARVKKFSGSNWIQVGDGTISSGAASDLSLAIDSSGTPYVAFSDNADGGRASVKKFNGTEWVLVGGEAISGSSASEISLAIDSSGTPYVAVVACSGVSACFSDEAEAKVVKLTGGVWADVGGVSFPAAQAMFVRLAVADSTNVYVAFSDQNNGDRANVMRFNGTAWVQVGGDAVSSGAASDISLALDGNDRPYVVFSDETDSGKANVKKFNDTAWVQVGGDAVSSGAASDISLALSKSNQPFVAYSDKTNSGKASVKKLNGTVWEQIGKTDFVIDNADNICLKLSSSGTLFVAFSDSDSKINVMKYSDITAMPWLNLLLRKK
jgi:hypothetical protein